MSSPASIIVRLPLVRLYIRRSITDYLWMALQDAKAGETKESRSCYGEGGKEACCEIEIELTDLAVGLAAIRRTLVGFQVDPSTKIIQTRPVEAIFLVYEP